MGECTKETSFAIMDEFYKLGGNFIDTANAYQVSVTKPRIVWAMKATHTHTYIYIYAHRCIYIAHGMAYYKIH